VNLENLQDVVLHASSRLSVGVIAVPGAEVRCLKQGLGEIPSECFHS